jgi:hypothetical protein
MIEGCREHLFRGLMYYLNSILFARPVRRFIIRFIKRVLMRRPYEFNSQSLFVIYNRDVGALIVDVLDIMAMLGSTRERKR